MAKVAARGVVSRIEWYRLAVAVVENSVMPRRDRWWADVQQIADWLKELGMSEYTERFADNHIDESILRELTDQDLKDLGVVSLGHRRKMLRAIAELAGSTPGSPQPAATPEPKPRDVAERRQVTVMFCDLVGSTGLAASMDPEDLREVVSAYQNCVAEIARHSDGFVAKYMGDGVSCTSGTPTPMRTMPSERYARGWS
jgi:SAM domain (Sterile alpha motif)/Adenylate and Guanylate cyclase catalytic domain